MKTEVIRIRVTKEMKEEIEAVASKEGADDFSEWQRGEWKKKIKSHAKKAPKS